MFFHNFHFFFTLKQAFHDFRIKTMLGSSLLYFSNCLRICVCLRIVAMEYCVALLVFFLRPVRVPYVASLSGLAIFDWHYYLTFI